MSHLVQPPKRQVIVVTGASSGFGRGTAIALAQRGASLVLAARRTELLKKVAAACEAAGGKAVAVTTDVARPEEIDRLAEAAIRAFGGIDGWINVAGVGAIGRFDEIPLADHRRVIETNLIGTLNGSHAAMRRFQAQGFGSLINVASMLGKVASPYYSSYSASKSAIVTLGNALRLELAAQGISDIHVSTVLPMAFDTPFFQHAANYTGKESVPIPPVYDAAKVVEAIVSLLERPKDEVIVGGMGVLADFAHHFLPGTVEAVTAAEVRWMQIEKAPAAAHSSGNLHHPVMEGNGLHGDDYPKTE